MDIIHLKYISVQILEGLHLKHQLVTFSIYIRENGLCFLYIYKF